MTMKKFSSKQQVVAAMMIMAAIATTTTTTTPTTTMFVTPVVCAQDIYYASSIYETKASMKVEISVVGNANNNEDSSLALTPGEEGEEEGGGFLAVPPDSLLFSTQDVYSIEQSSSDYFHSLLINDESTLRFLNDPQQDIMDLTVTVTNQQATTTSTNGGIIQFDAIVSLVHVDDVGSDGVSDLAALLTFLVDRNNTGAAYVYLDDEIRSTTTSNPVSKIRSMSFSYEGPSEVLEDIMVPQPVLDQYAASTGRSDTEKTLIIVVTFLSLALFSILALLYWMAGGWLELRKQLQMIVRREELEKQQDNNNDDDLKMNPTHETDDMESPSRDSHMTTPSGFLGVSNPYLNTSRAMEGYGIKMTPVRDQRTYAENDDEEHGDQQEIATPMSTMSEYSDSGRVPIGIMSMRKLMPGSTPARGLRGENNGNSDEDEEEEDDNNNESNMDDDAVRVEDGHGYQEHFDGSRSLPHTTKRLQF